MQLAHMVLYVHIFRACRRICSFMSVVQYLEAGGSVEQLHHVAYTGFGGLREPSLELLHHKQDQHLPGQSRAVLQSQ